MADDYIYRKIPTYLPTRHVNIFFQTESMSKFYNELKISLWMLNVFGQHPYKWDYWAKFMSLLFAFLILLLAPLICLGLYQSNRDLDNWAEAIEAQLTVIHVSGIEYSTYIFMN